MSKALMPFLMVTLIIGGVTWSICLLSRANVQGNEIIITQANDIILDGTDYNTTLAQSAPDLGSMTASPRIIVEYGDFAIKQGLTSNVPPFPIPPRIVSEYADSGFQSVMEPPQGLNTTGVTPRVIIEYADYASVIAFTVQRYPKPLFIGKPIRNPPNAVQPYQSVIVSVNVTGIWSSVKNVSLSYTTSANSDSWPNPWSSIAMNLTKHYDTNSTINLYEAIIPGQSPDTWVKYGISAYDNAGNYAENNNAGSYFIYAVPIPEFPSLIILPIFMVLTTLAVFLMRRILRKPKT